MSCAKLHRVSVPQRRRALGARTSRDFLDFFKGTDEEVQNEWLYYLEEAKENSGELYSMLNNRSVLLHKKKDAALLSAQIRRNIAKLKGQLNGLQGLLQKHADKITEGEHTR
eukprot:6366266-Pyramimonas_sp.AAC.1